MLSDKLWKPDAVVLLGAQICLTLRSSLLALTATKDWTDHLSRS